MYDKTKPIEVGHKLVELIEAVTDGVGMEDMDEFISLIAALQAAQTEMTTDTDAAILHVVSGATDAFGDKRINPPV